MMRRCRGSRNWQLRRQLGKDQFPGIQDDLGAGVESASKLIHISVLTSLAAENSFNTNLRYLRRSGLTQAALDTGWLYSPARSTHADAGVTAGFIQGGVHEK